MSAASAHRESPHPPRPEDPASLLRRWPSRTTLGDFARAACPAEVHAVSLALEGTWMASPWILDVHPWTTPPLAAWGPWDPGSKRAPGWWRLLAADGVLRAHAVRRVFSPGQGDLPGLLWLEVQARRMPSLVAPEGVRGPGFLLVPEPPDAYPSAEALRLRAARLASMGWTSFQVVDLADPEALAAALGGYALPGERRLSWAAGLMLARTAVAVPGFPKRGSLPHPPSSAQDGPAGTPPPAMAPPLHEPRR